MLGYHRTGVEKRWYTEKEEKRIPQQTGGKDIRSDVEEKIGIGISEIINDNRLTKGTSSY